MRTIEVYNITNEIYNEFPELLDERLSAILSGIVNSEFKSATMGFFIDDVLKNGNDIRNTAKNYVSDFDIIPGGGTFGEYCVETFVPRGLVKENKVKTVLGEVIGINYKITDVGEKYGKPIALFSLKTAVDNDLSMYDILGQTPTKGKNSAPYYRAKILLKTYEEDNLRIIDLEQELGLASTAIEKHLEKLKLIDFLEYESVSPNILGWSKYGWIEGKKIEDIDPEYGRKGTMAVASMLKEKQDSDATELTKKLGYKINYIEHILTSLKNQGFIEPTKTFKAGKKHSDINILEKGRLFVENYLNPVLELLEYGSSEVIDNAIRNLDPLYVEQGFLLYRKASPRFRRQSRNDIEKDILSLLRHEDNNEMWKTEIDRQMGKKDTSKYLKQMIEYGLVDKRKVGTRVYYFLKNQDDN